MYESFTNMYRLSKTLRFSLKPQGNTMKFMKERGLLAEDEARAKEKKTVQALADGYHKAFIDRVLEDFSFDKADLDAYIDNYLEGSDPDKTEACTKTLTEQVTKAFRQDKGFGGLFKADLYKSILPEYYANDEDALKSLSFFDGFYTYFMAYNRNREHIYSSSVQNGTIAGRLICDNLPIFIDNSRKFGLITERITGMIEAAGDALGLVTSGKAIGEFFDLGGYNRFLTQKEIDRYNQIIGGYALESGAKVPGLNEYIAIFNRRTKDRGDRLPKLTQLRKMILSERTSFSFSPEPFTEDNELLRAVKAFDDGFKSAEKDLQDAVMSLDSYDLSGIYVRSDAARNISNDVFGSWKHIETLLRQRYDDERDVSEKTAKTKSYREEKDRFFRRRNLCWSVAELDALPGADGDICRYIRGQAGFHRLAISSARAEMLKHTGERGENDRSLKRDSKAKAAIKAYLDAVNEFRRFMAGLVYDGAEKDEVFYADIAPGFLVLSEVTLLYNKTRNYLSGKLYTNEKFKLNFGSSVLLDGWSESVESTKLGTILRKDGRFYLGIIAKGEGNLFARIPAAETEDVYKKMCYNLISGANKVLPHVAFSDKGIRTFKPDDEILRIYKEGTFKKGSSFSLTDCRRLIDFYKSCIAKIPAWQCYDFHFSSTDAYEDISGFFREVELAGYSMEFRDIDTAVIDRLVEEGKLYLFEIWNKDFSEHSHGKKDLSTLYWLSVFDERNKKDLVYKLCGGAEVFFRKASIKEQDIIRHKAGDIVKAKNPLTKNQTRKLEYDIIKDRRFTVDHLELHVPITINATAPEFCNINAAARLAIKHAKRPHVIGVSRGERSLVSITVLDPEGNVVESRSLNVIGNTDYAELLTKREAARDAERKSWESVEGIKNVKDGYLGQVVRVLADLMIEYDAVIAIEDLNTSFKQSRQKIEKAVYQQLEEKLIRKLNLLVNKGAEEGEAGEPFRAYQLAGPFQGFDKIGRQTGFIFYVSPWNTTAIDSNTGFVNLFDTRYTSVAAAKKFWHSFDRICLDAESGLFRFDFDYSFFVDEDRARLLKNARTKWSIFAHGERISYSPEDGRKRTPVNLTDAFGSLFMEYGVDTSGDDLRLAICETGEKSFHEKLLKLFGLTVSLRNGTEIISPVMDENRKFFTAPADANGAYNIARKGLLLVNRIREADEEVLEAKGKDGLYLGTTGSDWLAFAQA